MIRNNSVSTRLEYPTLEAAVAEATFMAGMEKNSDLVFAAACEYLTRTARFRILDYRHYIDAPVLQHINSTQWAPDLIGEILYLHVRIATV